MLRISDTASGSLVTTIAVSPKGQRKIIPTPTALDGTAPGLAKKLRKGENADNVSSLSAYVRLNWQRLIPTPTTMDANGATAKMKSSQVKRGSMHSITLCRWASMLPTPTASDHRYRRKSCKWKGQDLVSQVQERSGTTGQLNPRFVAEMMGFPPNWTELPFQNGKTSQSSCTETQSCRK
jgi:hypothetical protein